MKNFIAYTLFASLFCLGACKDEEATIGHTTGESMAGEWWVTYSIGGVDVGGGYSEIITSNTAANVPTEIQVSDYASPSQTAGNFWSYTVKAQADKASDSFTADHVVSSALYNGDPYDIQVNVLNGKIFPGAGLSRTGVAVDSIYFEVQFEDDSPSFGTTFVVSGHKRTGFQADDY